MPSGWPKTEGELTEAGFARKGTSHCRSVSCRRSIVWFSTPTGNTMPMSLIKTEGARLYQPHWVDCPAAGSHKKKIDDRQGKLF